MPHTHNHSGKNLRLAFFLNLSFALFEIIGGLWTNSVAILSDALHDLGDSLSLGLSWYLAKKSRQGASARFTFGYRRFSLLGALINSLILVVGSVFIIIEAIERLQNPEAADARGMLIFAIVGVMVNGYAALKLSRGQTLNEKVVSWHLWEDVLGWVAVLIGSIVMLLWEVPWLDPALSLGISLFILYQVVKRLRETVVVFLQAKPDNIDLESIKEKIQKLDKVHSLHHTHLWTLDGEHHVFTTHIKLKYISRFEEIVKLKQQVKAMLSKEYGFAHYTIETELDEESCDLNL